MVWTKKYLFDFILTNQLPATYSSNSFSVIFLWATTKAVAWSPSVGWGIPKTEQSLTAGCVLSTFSISAGAI